MAAIDTKDFFNIDSSVSFKLEGLAQALLSFDENALSGIEEEVWEEARESDSVPNIGNIIQENVLGKLKTAIIDSIEDTCVRNYIEGNMNHWVNGMDTHFYMDGSSLSDIYEIRVAIDELTNRYQVEEADLDEYRL